MVFKQCLGAYEQRKLGQLYRFARLNSLVTILSLLGSFYFFTGAGQLLVNISNNSDEIRVSTAETRNYVSYIKKQIDDLPVEIKKQIDNTELADEVHRIKYLIDEIRDFGASIQATQATIEATILLIHQQFTNLLTRLGPIESDVSDILISVGEISSSSGAAATLLEASNEIQTAIEETTATIEATVASIETTIIEIEAKMPIGTLVERLNEEVHGMEVANLDFVQIDLDLCEYDPLGIGPINCEGLESEAGTLQGIRFTVA